MYIVSGTTIISVVFSFTCKLPTPSRGVPGALINGIGNTTINIYYPKIYISDPGIYGFVFIIFTWHLCSPHQYGCLGCIERTSGMSPFVSLSSRTVNFTPVSVVLASATIRPSDHKNYRLFTSIGLFLVLFLHFSLPPLGMIWVSYHHSVLFQTVSNMCTKLGWNVCACALFTALRFCDRLDGWYYDWIKWLVLLWPVMSISVDFDFFSWGWIDPFSNPIHF